MPYPCSPFYADIRLDNRFDFKLWNSIHVNHTINFVTKLRFMVWFNMEAIPKSDIKSEYDYTSQGFKMEYHATIKLNLSYSKAS